MEIEKTRDGGKLLVALSGKLDTTTAPELEKEMEGEFESLKELVFDMADLSYVSSAGLRTLFSCQKKCKGLPADMKIINANEDVREIFDITGFIDLLHIV